MGSMKKNNSDSRAKQLQLIGAKYGVLFLLGALAACSGDQASSIPSQKWQDVDIRVETRPSPPRAGMNEVLVMMTGERGRWVSDTIVSLRTDDHDAWTQAIQDGQIGVYRRAVEVEAGGRSVLQVQIKRNGAESILRFPLSVAP